MTSKTQERATAEAKEQAELEGEALELFNAWREVNEMDFIHDFKLLKDEGFDGMWIAVAERAREMAKEAPNA